MENKSLILDIFKKRGAILLRNTGVLGEDSFENAVRVICPRLGSYLHRSTPRTALRAHVYTSTEYHNDLSIPMHNECSYSNRYPEYIFFCCLKKPLTKGETPVVDMSKIYQLLPKTIVSEFEKKAVKYIRTFYPGVGLSWQETYQVRTFEELEKFCESEGVKLKKIDNHIIQTTQTRPASIVGDWGRVWFNQANLFHVASLPKKIKQSMLSAFDKKLLPKHAFFGDGSDIPDEYILLINELCEKHSHSFPWEEGDIMALNNRVFAHGRNPFTGERKIIVSIG